MLTLTRNDCPRCGLPVAGNSYEMHNEDGRAVYRHTTCPTSAALASLPALAAPIASDLPYLTITEAAHLLRVSPSTIRARIRRRLLPAWRLRGGQTVLVRRRDVEGLLDDVHGATAPRPSTKQPRPTGIPIARPIGTPLMPRPRPLPNKPRTHGPALPDNDRTAAALVDDREGIGAEPPLSKWPSALLTRRAYDANGNYPGGLAALKAEEAELNRRSSAKK